MGTVTTKIEGACVTQVTFRIANRLHRFTVRRETGASRRQGCGLDGKEQPSHGGATELLRQGRSDGSATDPGHDSPSASRSGLCTAQRADSHPSGHSRASGSEARRARSTLRPPATFCPTRRDPSRAPSPPRKLQHVVRSASRRPHGRNQRPDLPHRTHLTGQMGATVNVRLPA